MKKTLKISLIIIGILIFFSGCKNSNSDSDLKQKVNSEVSYLDSELVSMINELNSIDYSKYEVDVQDYKEGLEKNLNKQSEENQNSGEEKSEDNGKGDDGSKESENESNQQKESVDKQNSDSSKKNYSMKPNNVLGNEVNIDWDKLRSRAENLYSTWTVILADLSRIGIPGEKLDEFSSEIDLVAVATQKEDETALINELVKLYKSLSDFVEIYGNFEEKNVIYTKYNLLICYKYAMLENWIELEKALSDLKLSFSNINNKKDLYSGKEANIERAYIIISKMNNSKEVLNKEIFFIKYKNLMQELNVIWSN